MPAHKKPEAEQQAVRLQMLLNSGLNARLRKMSTRTGVPMCELVRTGIEILSDYTDRLVAQGAAMTPTDAWLEDEYPRLTKEQRAKSRQNYQWLVQRLKTANLATRELVGMGQK